MLQDVAERVINPRFRALADGQIIEKNPGDLVTVADREAEVLITAELRAAYPDAVILGEEAHSANSAIMVEYRQAKHAFTVDPVDGTKNFVRGSKDHAVMVGEVVDGETTRAWIWQPQLELAYIAERGQGVTRNGEQLHRGPAMKALADLNVHSSNYRWNGTSPGGLSPIKQTWTCCGVDYPQLIQGAADALMWNGTHPWDHVPGSLMLLEAGGSIGDFDGNAYQPLVPARGLIGAADEDTYRAVLAAMADAPPPQDA